MPDTLGWTAIAWIAVFWLVTVAADLGCTLLGTKQFGGSKWGMAGRDEDALRSGAGAAVGIDLSTVAKLGCAAVMVGLYVLSAWNALPWKILA